MAGHPTIAQVGGWPGAPLLASLERSGGLLELWAVIFFLRRGSRVDAGRNFAAAVGTEFVGGIHAALALATDGIQPALALRTKAKPRFDACTALRAVLDTGLP